MNKRINYDGKSRYVVAISILLVVVFLIIFAVTNSGLVNSVFGTVQASGVEDLVINNVPEVVVDEEGNTVEPEEKDYTDLGYNLIMRNYKDKVIISLPIYSESSGTQVYKYHYNKLFTWGVAVENYFVFEKVTDLQGNLVDLKYTELIQAEYWTTLFGNAKKDFKEIPMVEFEDKASTNLSSLKKLDNEAINYLIDELQYIFTSKISSEEMHYLADFVPVLSDKSLAEVNSAKKVGLNPKLTLDGVEHYFTYILNFAASEETGDGYYCIDSINLFNCYNDATNESYSCSDNNIRVFAKTDITNIDSNFDKSTQLDSLLTGMEEVDAIKYVIQKETQENEDDTITISTEVFDKHTNIGLLDFTEVIQ
ncbi:MAG: hypothetical protein IJW82_07045 [Clostridia bacterium]|nr:hypothetical protein [Clostridia bacterium]